MSSTRSVSERTKRPTEKGRSYNLELNKAERAKLSQHLYQLIQETEDVLNNVNAVTPLDVSNVKSRYNQVNLIYERLLSVQVKCLELALPEDCSHEEMFMEKVSQDARYHQTKCEKWLKHQQLEARSETSRRSVRSHRTNTSRASSRLSERLTHERVKLAELKAERSFSVSIQQKKMELEEMQTSMEMAKTEAKVLAYERELQGTMEGDEQIDEVLVNLPKMDSNAFTQSFVETLPSIQAEHPPISNPVSASSTIMPIDPLSESMPQGLDRVKPSTAFGYASFPKSILRTATQPHSNPVMNHPELHLHSSVTAVTSSAFHENTALQPSMVTTTPSTQAAIHSNKIVTSDLEEPRQMTAMFRELQAPTVLLDPFNGNPMDFPFFLTNFEQAVEEKVIDGQGRLARLIQYTTGPAKELVKSCIYIPGQEGYTRAKQLLKKKYGNPFIINAEYRKQLASWPRLKPNETASFNSFVTFLIKFQASMQAVGRENDSSPELLQLLQSKLPMHLQDRWGRKVHQIRKDKEREASLDDFISKMNEEVEISSDPLFSREAMAEMCRPQHQRPQRSKSLATNTKETCSCCNGRWHDLEKCLKYKELDRKAKMDHLFKQRLCFLCFQPTSKDHMASTCKKPRSCDVCKKSHPTSLHRDENVKSAFINNVAEIGLSVVRVNISHSSDPSKLVSTMALLDNGSQGTFITEDLLDSLGIIGTDACLEIQTVNGKSSQPCRAVTNLLVSPCDDTSKPISLPKVYSRSSLPVDPGDIPTARKLKKWVYLKSVIKRLPTNEHQPVGILIGSNCPQALEPMAVIQSQNNGPFATKTRLGWCVTGPMGHHQQSTNSIDCHRTSIKTDDSSNRYFTFKETIKDASVRQSMLAMYSLDFHEAEGNQMALSIEDERFLEIMKEGTQINGKHCLPLPLRSPEKIVPNNRNQVVQRASWLKKKLLNNPQMFEDYKKFMSNILENGYAKVAETPPIQNQTWYIPHHGVYHPKKPEKIRVVFDCSIEHKNYCLNKELLQGPDMTNQLIGVLLRFREEDVAVMADIESMFYQVRVPEKQQNYLRFVWWPGGDLSKEPIDHQMQVHLFGANSSPSCSNYALRKTAKIYKEQFGEEASHVLTRNFYVDDMLKSFIKSQDATKAIPNVVGMLAAGGFKLTKFHSNDRETLSTIPDEEKSKQLKNLDISASIIPEERALGMNWCTESDMFTFKIQLKQKPMTRRGILSTISSIYDPLGIAGPYLLEGKKILQQICAEKGWDDPLTYQQVNSWEKWKLEIKLLENFYLERCLHPSNFGEIVHSSYHHFSDASCDSYGQVSYIRFVNKEGQVSIRIVMAKSRVAPMKRPTVPRLELTASVVSVKVANSLKHELDVFISAEYFWTDSQVVLAYIINEVSRYRLFVANRVKLIREHSSLDQWKYVPSKDNPADDATRGLKLTNSAKDERWIHGPKFLYKPIEEWPRQPKEFTVCNEDKELKKVKCNSAVVTRNGEVITTLEKLTTKWHRMKRIVATILKWRISKSTINVDILQNAEIAIFRMIQRRAFEDEIKSLKSNQVIKSSSSLVKLSPFLDDDGLIRVGGRIRMADVPFRMKHPIILPKRCITTNIIINHLHEEIQHGGRNSTLNEIRSHGLWVINGNSMVRFLISKCVKCRILRGKSLPPKMADLPKDRIEPSPPFTYCGLDMFGPFLVRERRSDLKRYGIIFTCMSSRAVHLESVCSMDTDSFIMCLRRFIGRRGPVRTIRCDNGTNFVGAKHELEKTLKEMDIEKISEFLLRQGTDFIPTWVHNPPYSSNFGGAWERLIRSARAILDALMMTHGHSLNDESFRTFLVEIEAIMNSRPLTTDGLNDPDDTLLLSPINILTMKSKVVLPPPGVFQREDMYCRRRWRRVQHLSNEFWSKWRKEYLQHLQNRSKWSTERRNLSEGDVVLLRDEPTHRNEWKRGLVTKTHVSNDGIVRSVTVRHSNSEYVRPVNKLIVLVEGS